MRIRTGIVSASALLVLLLAPTQASAACLSAGGRTELAQDSLTPGAVDNGEVDKYLLTVPGGTTGYLHLAMFNGDIDIEVCRNSNNATVCEGTNFALMGDGCHAPELNDPLEFNTWGNALAPGTYRLDVKHCFSSVEGPGCDYLDNIQGTGVGVPGAHDAAPAVQYVLAFVTN